MLVLTRFSKNRGSWRERNLVNYSVLATFGDQNCGIYAGSCHLTARNAVNYSTLCAVYVQFLNARCFHMFFAFFHKKQHCRLKLDDSVTRKKAGGRRRTKAFTRKVLHREVFTLRSFCTQTPRSFYTQKVFTRRSLYTEGLLHTDAFAHRSFYTEKALHRGAFTHKRVYTQQAFYTHRGFYTEKPLRGAFYTQKVLHREVFTLRSFCAQTAWSFYTQKLLRREAFTHRALTHRRVYTQKLLHREAFTQRVFTQGSFYTQKNL